MAMVCDWCGKESGKLVQARLSGVQFKLCPDCIKSFKEHKCIKCGARLDNSKFYKGMCVQCAQVEKAIEERRQQDLENAYPEELLGLDPNPMTDKEFEDLVNGVGIRQQPRR